MTPPLRVLVLAGGLGPEREVSLRSGARVAAALQERHGGPDFEVATADLDAQLFDTIATFSPDVVFPVLHGGTGEDGATRDLLDALGVAYVGSGPGACRRAYDKPTAKSLLADAGAATPPSVALPANVFGDLGAHRVLDHVVGHLGLPLMVKPARGGSALGCTRVTEAAELPSAVTGCFGYDSTALLERFVDGTEVAVSVVDTGEGAYALPPVEIVPADGAYDYAARYTAGETEFFVPARLDPAVLTELTRLAVAAHTTLGLRDLSRTDAIVDADGTPWLLEVNVAPGLTETSLLPLAAHAAGHDLATLYGDLVLAAARRGGSKLITVP